MYIYVYIYIKSLDVAYVASKAYNANQTSNKNKLRTSQLEIKTLSLKSKP